MRLVSQMRNFSQRSKAAGLCLACLCCLGYYMSRHTVSQQPQRTPALDDEQAHQSQMKVQAVRSYSVLEPHQLDVAEPRPVFVRGVAVRGGVIHWGAHHPDSDAVLAMGSGYGMNEWRLFVGSLRRSGFEGDICVAVSQDDMRNNELLEYTKRMNVILYEIQLDCTGKSGRTRKCRIQGFYETDQTDFTPVSNSRFQIFMALVQIYNEDSVVFNVDFRDIYFAQNPFPQFRDLLQSNSASILVFEEAKELKIGMSGKNNGWNTMWISKCYGNAKMLELKDLSVFCSGTTAGFAGGMFSYFDAMVQELQLECSVIGGADQGMHNYLIHNKLLKPYTRSGNSYHVSADSTKSLAIHPVAQGRGPVNGLSALFRLRGPLKSLGLIDSEGFVLNENKQDRSAVVHQWDRDKDVSRWVKRTLIPQLAKENF